MPTWDGARLTLDATSLLWYYVEYQRITHTKEVIL
jgi:hypothetical protein